MLRFNCHHQEADTILPKPTAIQYNTYTQQIHRLKFTVFKMLLHINYKIVTNNGNYLLSVCKFYLCI